MLGVQSWQCHGHGQGEFNPQSSPVRCAGFLLGCCLQKHEKFGFIKAFIGSAFKKRECAEQITELLETSLYHSVLAWTEFCWALQLHPWVSSNPWGH